MNELFALNLISDEENIYSSVEFLSDLRILKQSFADFLSEEISDAMELQISHWESVFNDIGAYSENFATFSKQGDFASLSKKINDFWLNSSVFSYKHIRGIDLLVDNEIVAHPLFIKIRRFCVHWKLSTNGAWKTKTSHSLFFAVEIFSFIVLAKNALAIGGDGEEFQQLMSNLIAHYNNKYHRLLAFNELEVFNSFDMLDFNSLPKVFQQRFTSKDVLLSKVGAVYFDLLISNNVGHDREIDFLLIGNESVPLLFKLNEEIAEHYQLSGVVSLAFLSDYLRLRNAFLSVIYSDVDFYSMQVSLGTAMDGLGSMFEERISDLDATSFALAFDRNSRLNHIDCTLSRLKSLVIDDEEQRNHCYSERQIKSLKLLVAEISKHLEDVGKPKVLEMMRDLSSVLFELEAALINSVSSNWFRVLEYLYDVLSSYNEEAMNRQLKIIDINSWLLKHNQREVESWQSESLENFIDYVKLLINNLKTEINMLYVYAQETPLVLVERLWSLYNIEETFIHSNADIESLCKVLNSWLADYYQEYCLFEDVKDIYEAELFTEEQIQLFKIAEMQLENEVIDWDNLKFSQLIFMNDYNGKCSLIKEENKKQVEVLIRMSVEPLFLDWFDSQRGVILMTKSKFVERIQAALNHATMNPINQADVLIAGFSAKKLMVSLYLATLDKFSAELIYETMLVSAKDGWHIWGNFLRDLGSIAVTLLILSVFINRKTFGEEYYQCAEKFSNLWIRLCQKHVEAACFVLELSEMFSRPSIELNDEAMGRRMWMLVVSLIHKITDNYPDNEYLGELSCLALSFLHPELVQSEESEALELCLFYVQHHSHINLEEISIMDLDHPTANLLYVCFYLFAQGLNDFNIEQVLPCQSNDIQAQTELKIFLLLDFYSENENEKTLADRVSVLMENERIPLSYQASCIELYYQEYRTQNQGYTAEFFIDKPQIEQHILQFLEQVFPERYTPSNNLYSLK